MLDLVLALDGKNFDSESSSRGIEYFAADVEFSSGAAKSKCFRLVWLFEGDLLEVIGVINAYRVKKKRS